MTVPNLATCHNHKIQPESSTGLFLFWAIGRLDGLSEPANGCSIAEAIRGHSCGTDQWKPKEVDEHADSIFGRVRNCQNWFDTHSFGKHWPYFDSCRRSTCSGEFSELCIHVFLSIFAWRIIKGFNGECSRFWRLLAYMNFRESSQKMILIGRLSSWSVLSQQLATEERQGDFSRRQSPDLARQIGGPHRASWIWKIKASEDVGGRCIT